MVEQRPQSAGDDTGCELVVRVEQRDGPVAGWLRSVCPLALVEQGDPALGHVRWQSGCARLEGLAEHGGELWAKLAPEARTYLVTLLRRLPCQRHLRWGALLCLLLLF